MSGRHDILNGQRMESPTAKSDLPIEQLPSSQFSFVSQIKINAEPAANRPLSAISQYKFIIKKLQHLIGLLSYNQSNMNLEEMVRFLTNIQATYNQLLSGYVGVFYVLKKCQYKNMCFDCAMVTGHLQKMMMETNYTSKADDLSEIHLSNRTLNYLKSRMINRPSHRNHTKGKPRKSVSKFLLLATSIHLNQTAVNGEANLTQLLSINKKLHKAFNKLIKPNGKEAKRRSVKLALKKDEKRFENGTRLENNQNSPNGTKPPQV